MSEAQLNVRSVCALFVCLTTLFMVLRCHPLTCTSLKLRLIVDSNPIAPTIFSMFYPDPRCPYTSILFFREKPKSRNLSVVNMFWRRANRSVTGWRRGISQNQVLHAFKTECSCTATHTVGCFFEPTLVIPF
jgi:hypothetical protein